MENFNTQENVNEPKTPKTPKEKTIFGLKIAGNVVFYALIVMLLLFSIMNINAGSRSGGFPNLFGRGFLAVMTDSMNGEVTEYEIDSFKAGDLVYEKVFKDDDCSNLKVGDVITFYDDNPQIKALNTHRIVYISPDNSYVVTMGDYEALSNVYDYNDKQAAYDLESQEIVQAVTASDIKGVVTGVKPGAGKTLFNLQEYWFPIFVLPVLLFLLVEIYFVIKNIMDLRGAKQKAELASDKEAMMADLESQKEEMRKQILEELKAEQEKKTAEADKDKE